MRIDCELFCSAQVVLYVCFFALKVPLHKSNHKSNYTGFTAVCF